MSTKVGTSSAPDQGIFLSKNKRKKDKRHQDDLSARGFFHLPHMQKPMSTEDYPSGTVPSEIGPTYTKKPFGGKLGKKKSDGDDLYGMYSFVNIFLAILAFFLPPLSVFAKKGFSVELLINCVLCFIGFWIGGVAHAWYIISTTPGTLFKDVW